MYICVHVNIYMYLYIYAYVCAKIFFCDKYLIHLNYIFHT